MPTPENTACLARINSKIANQPQVLEILNTWRKQGANIVFTNGCFDILHRGHLEYLATAADLGSRLIVGLNEDASVTRLKGAGRPVNTYADRAFALAALEAVSMVVPFGEDTPEKLIQLVRPDILVKGGDYTVEQIVGAGFVEENGGKVVVINFTEGYSTTRFLNRIKEG
ncbi:MAG: D-glycero-beta-D-manno-heptose 1-phosphate adenylyltransferase [Bacteroidia bacterium]|jgi:rfaE bifunctional protein nucleotidyltransferase chain/domain|nr:D-glycero-beta-D-manno-heptose 1-phosphate adenylyltransferase [Bacteroidia bacterium]MCC6767754.1 D-glycero-beta-D-manno-heptose 1-phosphate adenylyltransferase [Bacteroidia bacterium]